MHEEWTDKLSDYLDGELAGDERYAVESHLAGCPDCTRVLADLRRVVERARALEPRPPRADLWDGIALHVDERPAAAAARFPAPATQRVSFTLPQLAAAAVLLMAVTASVVWLLVGASTGPRDGATAAPQPAAAQSASDAQAGAAEPSRPADVAAPAAAVGFADAQYDAAVADLESALAKQRGHLDPATVAVVEHNLRIIDQAIAQARQALAADPANSYLSGHLVEARRRKLDLLRRAASLTETSD